MFVFMFNAVMISGIRCITLMIFVFESFVLMFTCTLFIVFMFFMFALCAVHMCSNILVSAVEWGSIAADIFFAGDDAGFFQHDDGKEGGDDRQKDGDNYRNG